MSDISTHALAWDPGFASWDIFVQRIPDGAYRVGDIPSDFVPGPLGPRGEIVAGIRDVFPRVDFSDPEWGLIDESGFTIEINIKADDPVMSFALHVRGDSSAASAVAALLDRLGFRAFDPQSPTGLFDADASRQSIETFRAYRDEVVERQRRSPDTEREHPLQQVPGIGTSVRSLVAAPTARRGRGTVDTGVTGGASAVARN